MTTPNTQEENKLIAEFMGANLIEPIGNLMRYIEFKTNPPDLINLHSDSSLKYHTSWDWLMPVLEKIAKIEIKDCPVISNGEDSFFDSYYPRTFGMVSSETKEFLVRINRFPLHYSKSLIEATWEAVVEFIQWYNTTSKPLTDKTVIDNK